MMTTQRLILKEVTWDDLQNIHNLHSLPSVDEFNTLGIPGSIDETKEVVKAFVEAPTKDPQSSYTWSVWLKSEKEFIGIAGLTLSNDKYRLGEIYYKLHPDYWGVGYATELAKGLISCAFEDHRLHKVEAGVATNNSRSIKVLEKAGMLREGLRRKILPIRGEWLDNYHYGIVEDDERDY